MKPFVRNLLAVIAGTAIMWILGFLILTFFVSGVLKSFEREQVLPSPSVLVLDLSTLHIDEQSTDLPAAGLGGIGLGTPTLGVWDACDAIVTAAYDPSVRCLYLKPDGGDAGAAAVEELREAVRIFHQSGKPVVSCIQNPSNASLYLATAADKVFMTADHGGISQVVGVSAQLYFLKDLLDRLGIHVQLIRHGKYKSAGEMFVRSSSSPENREQNREMVASIWDTFATTIAEARGIERSTLEELVGGLKLNLPEDFLAAGLVDELAGKDGVATYLARMAGVPGPEQLALVDISDYAAIHPLADRRGTWRIAVVFVNGDLVDEASSYGGLTGDQYADILTGLRYDSSVRAVVLRVNSPGGSVLASSKIRDAVDLLGEVKPVVASYGNYAASGGYWISSGCRTIYTDATTLTGSIGVFSMIPDFSKTAREKLHVGVESVGSHPHSDVYSLLRPLDATELAFVQTSVEDIYERFVGLVAAGRGLEEDFVDSVAQGRVWTGAEARELGLADAVGTLQDALCQAAALSGGPEDYLAWQVVQYPAKATWADMIEMLLNPPLQRPTVGLGAVGAGALQSIGAGALQSVGAGALLQQTPFAGLAGAFEDLLLKDPTRVYARMPYAIEVK